MDGHLPPRPDEGATPSTGPPGDSWDTNSTGEVREKGERVSRRETYTRTPKVPSVVPPPPDRDSILLVPTGRRTSSVSLQVEEPR